MKIDIDLNDNLFDEACRLTGMCCLLMARDGERVALIGIHEDLRFCTFAVLS